MAEGEVRRYGDAVIDGMVVRGRDRAQLQGLLLGIKKGNELRYVGQTDFGFQGQSKELLARLVPLIHPDPLFRRAGARGRIQWVEPRVVYQVRFSA